MLGMDRTSEGQSKRGRRGLGSDYRAAEEPVHVIEGVPELEVDPTTLGKLLGGSGHFQVVSQRQGQL